MRLLVVINNLGLGGAERLLCDQLRNGQGRWETRVVCLDSLGPLAEELRAQGIPVSNLRLRVRWDPRAIPRLRAQFSAWRPDVVHLHLPRSAFFGRLASLGMAHRVVYTEHNTWDGYPAISRRLNAVTYKLNTKVVAVSSPVKSWVLRELGPRISPKLVLIPNAVDVASLQRRAPGRAEARRLLGLEASDLVIGNVANLFLRKGQSYLLDAARAVIARVPRARFVLVGAGDQEARLKAQAQAFGAADRIIFAGPVREAFRLMPAFDVFCLSSIAEGMPVALLEAMSLGVPAVSTDVGGIPDVIVPNETGVLVPAGDRDRLGQALIRMLTDEDFRRATGQASRARILKDFSMDKFVESYDRVYRQSGQ